MAPLHGIDLEQYRTRARELLKLARAANPDAMDRIRNSHPEHAPLIDSGRIQLADTQLVIARENGFTSWPRLKEHLIYRNAVEALDEGGISRLEALLDRHPRLISARCRTGEWYDAGYFQGAMLLHHIAGNPIRRPIPRNVLDVTRLLLRRGADPNATTESGETPIGLLVTSKQASEAGVAVPLIDVLREHGAKGGMEDPANLDSALCNAAPATAAELVKRGAKLEARHAAGLGRLQELEALLAQEADPLRREEALVFACIRGQVEAARILVRHGARGDVLVAPGGQTPRTALHEAANRGHESIVRLLLENGADARVVEPHWGGTAAGWARHGEPPHLALAELLDRHASTG